MADREHHGEPDPGDLELARAIAGLDRDIQPERDLWPGIERNIVARPQRDRRDLLYRWMPVGVAASLVFATAALVLSIVRFESTGQRMVSFERPMDNMQAAYFQVRNPMMAKFSKTNRNLDPVTLDDLYRNFEIMENARREIERQLREHPHDQRLIELLMKVHEQELDLLKQNYTMSGSHAM